MRRGLFALALGLSVTVSVCALAQTSDSANEDSFKLDLSRDDSTPDYSKYLSARFAASEHNLSDAAKYYRDALADDPGNVALLTLAFFYSTSSGDVDGAAKYAKQVTAAAGGADDRAARLVLAVKALNDDEYADARKQLGQSDKGPFTALTSVLLDAWAAAGAGDSTTAISDLKSLSNQTGADALAAFHLAMLYEFLGRTADADASYRDALLKAGPSPRIVDAYGRFLERNGQITEASALYAKLSSDNALQPIVEQGQQRIARNDKPDPLVSEAKQGAAEALFGIAGSLTDQTSADVSILYLRLALYLRPDLDLADILLGDRLETLQKYEDAIAVYRSIDTSSPYWRVAEVQIAVDEAQLDKAIADLKKATVDAPNDSEAWTGLGDAYRAAERWSDAAAAYDKALAALGTPSQKDWPLFYARGIAEDRQGQWDKAQADLQEALKLSPDEPQVLNYIGYSWVDQGHDIPQALAMLEKARQLRPFDGYIVDSVGWAYFKLGRYPDAAKTLEAAILLVPGDPTINDHLGDAYWRVGKKLDARFQWSHALAFGPEPVEKSTLEKKLKDGLPSATPG